ncbi:MAG: ATP-binding protein, partial [Chromatiales bacterium]|nr:ATP-binding protein [Chromatiales bacterium]
RAAAFNKWERNELLNEIHSLIGYGGLIHDFKNYVLRGTPFYYERFNQHFLKTQQALSQFRRIKGIGKKELAYVDIIKETLLRYQKFMDTITKMHSRRASAEEIDRVVKVDDSPALNAITSLRSDISSLDTSSWWPNTTKRINQFKEISNTIRNEIIQHIAQHQSAVTRTFYLYITLMLLVITATLLLAHLLINRLAKETSLIAAAMNNMHQSGQYNALSLPGGDDEIGEIVSAFNTLVEKRNLAEAAQLKSQQQLLETKKANALYKLSGGVAHNFNNMLTAILGYSSMAMTHKDIEKSEKVKSYLGNINKIVERASALIAQMTAYSQAEFKEKKESVQVGTIVKEFIELQQNKLPSTIELTRYIESNLPSIHIDQDNFKRVFNALFTNAVEAAATKINIQLQITNLTNEQCSACNETLNGAFIELSIEDNGTGIASDKLEHLFEPFFTTKDLSEGAGMGLAMAYGIIRSCGGHTIVESTPEEGSKFRVLLPLMVEQSE